MILISSCLIGEAVRFDGKAKEVDVLSELISSGQAMHACPELLGGLTVPREPAEIIGGDGHDVWHGKARVVTISGQDVTAQFKQGAHKTLELCQMHQIDTVILKANSPSCGSKFIYDGTFTGNKTGGSGVTTALLEQNGIKVVDEQEYLT